MSSAAARPLSEPRMSPAEAGRFIPDRAARGATHGDRPRPLGIRPPAELAEGKPHGTRVVYMAGCRCGDCRKANAKYQSDRYRDKCHGGWNGIIPSDEARRHLLNLSRHGVGRRQVAKL